MTFDARAIKTAAPGAVLTSADHPGLRLIIRQTRRTWVYRYLGAGEKLAQVKLGQWPAMSVTAAIAAWGDARSARQTGSDPAAQAKAGREAARAARAPVLTIEQGISDYHCEHLLRRRNLLGATKTLAMLRLHSAGIASRPLGGLTRAEVFEIISTLAARAPVVAMQFRREMGTVVDHAIDAGRLPEAAPNWWRRVMQGKITSRGKILGGVHQGQKTPRVLTQDELQAVLRWLPSSSLTMRDVLTLYLWTCARGDEIVQMRGDQLGFVDGVLWWTLPKALTKNARVDTAADQRVPLIGRAREIAQRRAALYGAGWLFPTVRPTAAGHMLQKSIGSTLYQWLPSGWGLRPSPGKTCCPVDRWSPHDLRRTGRTLLAQMGCPDEVGEVILAHVKPGVVGVYNLHRYDPEKLDWLTRLAARLESLAAW